MKDSSGHTKPPSMSLKRKTRDISEADHKIRCTQLGVGDMILLKRTAFKGKHNIQDCWEDTIYCVKEQPYAGLPVFKIDPVTGKVR